LAYSSLSFKPVHEALGEVEREKSTIFSTLGLTSAAWQLQLQENQRHMTSFSCPGLGQFEWIQAPHHLAGARAAFHRLLGATVGDLPGVIPHLDKIIIHAASMTEHLSRLNKVLKRLQARNLTINVVESSFATNEAKILGYQL
jgi:hypothetical protein